MEEKIAVSIICNTYNHEKYIADALESFVMQKTDFKFEVLVHDDASTDKTADIIREYEKKYPEIIKPIYQTENQYRKGGGITYRFQVPRIKGEFVAFCEGDDYWTDELKLQKQYDALMAHPEVDMCAHAARKVKADSKEFINDFAPKTENCIIPVQEVIEGGGGFVSTNSLMYRKTLYDNIYEFRKKLASDYSLQIQGSLRGGLLYLKDNMSDYRVCVPGSWTDRNNKNKEIAIVNRQKVVDMLKILDKETNYRYTNSVKDHIAKYEFEIFDLKDEQRKMLKYKDNMKSLNPKLRRKVIIKAMFPFLIKIKRRLDKR